MSQFFTIGVSYRTTPLSEMLSLSKRAVVHKLRHLKSVFQISEAAILSTCNRTEVYCLGEASDKDIASWLAGDAADTLYTLRGREAVTHLFRVACGLESAILGETEITAQVKQAAAQSRLAGASGGVIGRLLDDSLAAAKEVRTCTAIGRHSLSYPALAARAAANIFPDWGEVSVLFVGGGDMTLSGAPIFLDKKIKHIAFAGRTADNAEKLAARFGGEGVALDKVRARLAMFDIVVSSTASRLPIIGKGMVEKAVARRRHKPMMFADLALPPDVEPEVAAMPDVFLYTLEDFCRQATHAAQSRQAEVSPAAAIIDARVRRFYAWLERRRYVPQVRTFRDECEQARRAETERALEKLAQGADARAVVESLSRRLTGKLIHRPSQIIACGGAPEDDSDIAQ